MSINYPSMTIRAISRDGTLTEAAKLMVRDQIGSLLIRKDKGSPIEGILTDRDIVKQVAEGRDPSQTTVASFTGRPVTTAPVDASRYEMTRKIRTHGIRRLPLVDDAGEVVSIISFDDLIIDLGRELFNLSRSIETEMIHESPLPDLDE